MRVRKLVFAAIVVGAVLAPAGVASADILVTVPPSPIAPPPTEPQFLVAKTAPVTVSVVFVPDPGPPDIAHP